MRRFLVWTVIVIAVLLGGMTAFDYLAPYQSVANGLKFERGRAGLQLGHTTVQGLDIAYLQGGNARDSHEPLVLVHGFGADKDNFTRVAQQLSRDYYIISPDLPGFGDSSKPADASYRIADQVERLHGFVSALGHKRVHLGGSSMGGYIVTQYAATYPDEVASLWLLGPAGTEKALDSELSQIIRDTGANPLLSQKPEDFPAVMDFVMSKEPFFPYSFKRVLGERAAANYPLHKKIFEQLTESPVIFVDAKIEGLQTPALVVWGNEDRALNYEAAEVYKAKMPNAQVVIMEGIGHLPMIEAPRQAAGDYRSFRASLKQKTSM